MSDKKEIKRVLAIGQLPVEMGGNYTTGMGKVVYELSLQHYSGLSYKTLALNTKDKKTLDSKYSGYTFSIGELLKSLFLHPLKLYRELQDYRAYLDYSPLRALFYRANMDRVIDKLSPDCVHLHSIDNVIPFSHTEKKEEVKSIITCHGIFGVEGNEHRRKLYVESLARVDYATGLTEDIDRLISSFHVPDKKRSVIPNGVDVDKFRYDEKARQTIRHEWNIPDDRTIFITVGSLQHRKGQLDFMSQLKDCGIDYEYWIIGSGPDKDKIEKWVHNNGQKDRIRLIGYIPGEDLYRYYSAADVYAHTSYAEGQALSEIEAYTTGLKILVNQDVVRTLANSPENESRYRVISFEEGIMWDDKLIDWIKERESGRTTDGSLNWQKIADMYTCIYKKLIQ